MDFVAQMLQYDQTKRPTALEALRHPFVCERLENPGGVEADSAELFESELRGASTTRFAPGSNAYNGGGVGGSSKKPVSETGKFAKKPPKRLASSKGKVVAKPEKPRTNNATKKARHKPGASI